jgi:tRNA 2-thiouridine synthesizing protein A
MSATLLDAKGLTCPQPLMRTKKALAGIPVGSLLEVHATDPGSAADLLTFCKRMGHEMVEKREEGGVHVFLIRRGR